MHALSASGLLDIWERGSGRPPVEQALVILGAAFPQAPPDDLSRLDFVQRDLCLLHLRSLTFGPQIKGLADCPACGHHLEFDFDARELPAWTSPLPNFESAMSLNPESSLSIGGYEMIFRLPNSMDLFALSRVNDEASMRQQLVGACVISVQQNGKALTADELPSQTLNVLLEQIGKSHPLADLTLSLTCPACSHFWELLFDIVSYFWSEIHAWSIRLLREVHALAMAYGWQEADILGMSAWRRQHYLEMIGAG